MTTTIAAPLRSIVASKFSLKPHQWLFVRLKRFIETGGKCIRWNKFKWKKISESINDSKLLSNWNSAPLPKHFGKFLDERIIEYPALFHELKDLSNSNILDAGSTANFDKIVEHQFIKRNKLTIATLAYEGHQFCDHQINYVFEDLRDLSFKDSNFDFIFSISTIEHIGMDNTSLYTTEQKYQQYNPSDYLLAVKEMRRVLKDNGKLFLTVPCGKRRNLGWLQIFDEEMIDSIIESFSPKVSTVKYFRHLAEGWKAMDTFQGVADAGYSSQIIPVLEDNPFDFYRPGAEAVAVITLTK